MASDCGSRRSWTVQYRQPSPAPKAYAGESFDGVSDSDSDSDDDRSRNGPKSNSCTSGVRYGTGRGAASATGSVPPSTSFFCRQGVNGNAGLARRSSPDIATHHAEQAPRASDGALLDDEGGHGDHFHYPTTAIDEVKSPTPSQHAHRFLKNATDPPTLESRATPSRFQPSPPLNEQQSFTQATSAAQKQDKLAGPHLFPARVFKPLQSASSSVVALQTLSSSTSIPQRAASSPLGVHLTSQQPLERHFTGSTMPSPRFGSVKHAQPQDASAESKEDDKKSSPTPLPPDEDVPPMLHLLRGLQPAFVSSEQGAGAVPEIPAAAMAFAPTEDEVVQSTSHVRGSERADFALQKNTADQQVNEYVPERGIACPAGKTSQKSRAAITLSEYLESSGKTRHTCDRCGTILTPEAIAFIKASDAAAAARDRKVAFRPPSRPLIKQEPLSTTEGYVKGANSAPFDAVATSASNYDTASSKELNSLSSNGGTGSTGLSASSQLLSDASVVLSETPDATWDGLERLADLSGQGGALGTSSISGAEGSPTADKPMTGTEELGWITKLEQDDTKCKSESDKTSSTAGEILSLPERGTSPVLSDVTVKHGVEMVRAATNTNILIDEGETPVSPQKVIVGGWTVSRTTTPSSATSTPSTGAFSPGPLSSPISSVSSQESSPTAPANGKPYKVSGWTVTPKNIDTTAFVQQSVLGAPQHVHPDRALMLIDVEPQAATLLPPQRMSEPKGLGIGWGDEDPSTLTKAPNLAWDPEVAIKKLPSPTNPTGVRGLGRSPSNSAAPAERVLAPPLNEWRGSFEHVRSPVDRPSSSATASQTIHSPRIEHQRADAIPSALSNSNSASVHYQQASVFGGSVQSERMQGEENSGRESPFKARDENGSPVFKHFATSTYGDFRGSKASQWANGHSRPASAAAHVSSMIGQSSGWEQPALASSQGGQHSAQDTPRDGWGQIIERVKESASYRKSISLTTSAMSSLGTPAAAGSPQTSVLSSRSTTPTPSSSWKTAKTASQDFNAQRVSSPMPFIPKSYQGWQKPQATSQAGVQSNQEGLEAGAGWSMPAPTFQAPARSFVSLNSSPTANSAAIFGQGWIA